MRVFAGTSGFSYPEWKGPFYPADLPDRRFLSYYAAHLDTVEINNTFYRMPRADLLTRWVAEVPEGFRFVLKAPQRITHRERLSGSADSVTYFWKNASVLADRLGPVLFQLPPYLRAEVARLREFLGVLPAGLRPAFEFRHASWFDSAVTDVLAEAGAALCIADVDEGADPEIIQTTDFGYLRLRRAAYSDRELAAWAERVLARDWREVYVYFKHEEAGAAPHLAQRFLAALAAQRAPGEAPASRSPATRPVLESDPWR